MKTILASTLILVLLALAALPFLVSAQGIGVPIPTAHPIGVPILVAPPYPPTWSAPWPQTGQPGPVVTVFYDPTPTDLHVVQVRAISLFYEYNRYTGLFGLVAPIAHSNIGDVLSVRYQDATWAQILTPHYAGWYLERWALKELS